LGDEKRGAAGRKSGPQRLPNVRPGRRSVGASAKPRRSKMRSIVIAAVMALGLGLVGLQASSAAPMNGAAPEVPRYGIMRELCNLPRPSPSAMAPVCENPVAA